MMARFAAQEFMLNGKHQRWEPAATDARFATGLNGWLPSAECC